MTSTTSNASRGPAIVLDFQSAGRLMTNIMTEDLASAPTADLPRITGYLIDRRLGRGGGGQVFHALRDGSTKSLALKLLNKSLANPTAASRAWRELDVLSDLHLTGFPQIEDYGTHEGRMYIVTTHVEGLTLADHCTQKNLDRRARVQLLADVADCVQRLHEHGVIHRDIKPDNVIIGSDAKPVIVDFGIAALLSNEATETLTEDGVPIGTPAFMAPEQARGDREHTSTRSDVYGLGATACLVLTGKTPHDVTGPLHAAIQRVANELPRTPQELDPTLDHSLASVLRRATEPSPDERYPSAAAFAEDLRRWLRDEVIEWQGPNWFSRQALAWRRNPQKYATRVILATLVLTCLGTTTVALAKARWARQGQLLAEGRLDLKLKEEEFKVNESKRAAHWEAEARRLAELAETLTAREFKVINLRERQKQRIQLAVDQGALFDASVVLLNLAEDIQAYAKDDQAVLNEFVSTLNGLFDAAKKQKDAASN